MRTANLISDRLVEWQCIEQDYPGMSDWIGTTIRFRLAENARQGTDLDFAHPDSKSTEGSYHRCTSGWAHVLGTSLKNYLEAGKGSPYLEQIEKESARKAS